MFCVWDECVVVVCVFEFNFGEICDLCLVLCFVVYVDVEVGVGGCEGGCIVSVVCCVCDFIVGGVEGYCARAAKCGRNRRETRARRRWVKVIKGELI